MLHNGKIFYKLAHFVTKNDFLDKKCKQLKDTLWAENLDYDKQIMLQFNKMFIDPKEMFLNEDFTFIRQSQVSQRRWRRIWWKFYKTFFFFVSDFPAK